MQHVFAEYLIIFIVGVWKNVVVEKLDRTRDATCGNNIHVKIGAVQAFPDTSFQVVAHHGIQEAALVFADLFPGFPVVPLEVVNNICFHLFQLLRIAFDDDIHLFQRVGGSAEDMYALFFPVQYAG